MNRGVIVIIAMTVLIGVGGGVYGNFLLRREVLCNRYVQCLVARNGYKCVSVISPQGLVSIEYSDMVSC